MDRLALGRILQFGDSMLPTGAFAFSGALEAAVQTRAVHDAETLRQFVESAVEQAASGDAVGMAWALRAARGAGTDSRAWALLGAVDEALFVRKAPEEARAMLTRTGAKLAELGAAVTASPLAARWLERIRAGATPGTSPVSMAVLFAAMGGAAAPATADGAGACATTAPGQNFRDGDSRQDDLLVRDALIVHLYGVMTGILNAALRLMRLTHVETQSLLYRLAGRLDDLAARAAAAPLENMSAYAPMTDILSAIHARAHVRLFMS
ncbi:MAG: urease accessory protein UreF [Desulfovibrionaceae bacterium]|nr:urease accessory protein UreF [Desulfovibrionaceae bacterium]